MRVLLSGSSGFIGAELRSQLAAHGIEVIRLVRRAARSSDEHSWSPSGGIIDSAVMDGVDAVINLSGASTAHLPWTDAYMREIKDSRVHATRTLVDAMSRASTPPATLLNASGVGYYGDRPGEDLADDATKGTGFMSDVVEAWERTARLAPHGTRVVTFRTGLVVGDGGAFSILGPLTKFGLGSKLGDGSQRWPWISLHDEAAAIIHLLTSSVSGPVNLVGPTPATADAVTRRLSLAMKRPRFFSIPTPLIELGLRTPGRELLLPSVRAIPQKLLDDGFEFTHPTVADAIGATWG